MRQKLRRRRGDRDDSARPETAGTAGKTAASGADRALTARAPERGAIDGSRAEPADDADRTARGAASSGQAADGSASGGNASGSADRIWHSPAAGLPTPIDSGGGNRSREDETAEPSKPAAKGTYRVLTEEVAARSRSAAGGTDRPAAAESGETTALSTSGTEGTDRARGEQTAAPAGPGASGTGRPANGDAAALSQAAASSREPRPAVGDLAGRSGRAADAVADSAETAADSAARQGNGGAAAGVLRTARSGSHEPLLGDAAALRANWQRVQGDFVDDPRAAVSSAADLVEHTAQALVGALRQRQQELRGLWDETAAGDAGAAPDGGWPAGGRHIGPWHRGRKGAGWLGRGWVRAAGPGGERMADVTPDGGHPRAGDSLTGDGSPGAAGGSPETAGGSPETASGTPTADTTEYLRLVMQRYRALFNQICRP